MASLEELIEQTKDVIGSQIKKPKMTDKLLGRPPFRFLHDTIMAMNGKTGLLDSLLTEEEKDSGTIADKEAKVAFLQKIINFTEICCGATIDVRASKIVAGAEAENTNMFLIAFGKINIDDSIDYAAAAKMTLNGSNPGKIPRKGGASKDSDEAKQKEPVEEKSSDESKASQEEADAKAEAERKAAAAAKEKKERERERRRQEKELEKQRQAQAEAAESKSSDAPRGVAFDISQVDGETETTINLFENLIKKPKLNDKLLSKPPFRFLHDIMTNLNAGCGIVEGLFEGDELDARQCSSKEAKVGYLDKLIQFAEYCSGSPVEAKSSRIVSGHEPDKTNKLLQVLALIAKNDCVGSISAKDAISRVLGGSASEGSEEVTTREEPTPIVTKERPDRRRQQQQEDNDAEDEPASRTKSVPLRDSEEKKEEDQDEGKQEESNARAEDDEEERKPLVRPQTARKRPPKIKEKAAAVSAKETQQTREQNQQVVGVMMDGQDDSDESDQENDADRDVIARRQVENNSAMDGQKLKGRMVRDILEDEQKNEHTDSSNPATDESKLGDGNSNGITMGKIGQGLRRGNKSAGVGSIDVDKVSRAIQTLCQSTNPLGKCMDYIHEDLSVMAKELERWKSDYRKSCDALEDEQRSTSETLHPLRGKLLEVDEKIKDEQIKLTNLKASIAKNDQRISELLRDMVLN